MMSALALVAGTAFATVPKCADLLDPRRDVGAVRRDLAVRGALVPVTPPDRELVERVARRCCVRGLDPEVAWTVDGRWILYRARPRPTRVFTADLAFEVHAPALIETLDRRLTQPQVTVADARDILTDVSVHAVDTRCRTQRQVIVDGRAHSTTAVDHLGYEDAPPAVRRLLTAVGVVDSFDEVHARRRRRVPRFARWSKFLGLRLTELRLGGEPSLAPGDVIPGDLPRRYVETLINGTIPVIIERWDLDEGLRHAVAAPLVPPAARRWFQSVAARVVDADEWIPKPTFKQLNERLMRQFEGLLDLAALVADERVHGADEFYEASRFVWPTLTRYRSVPPPEVLQGDPTRLARDLNAGVLSEEPPDADTRAALDAVYREMLARRSELLGR